jgi:predicted MFS family arabinose efflux permease
MGGIGLAAGGRVRVLGGFAAFGAFWGAWGAALPAVQDHAGVDDGQLGVALLFIGAGALVSMRGAGTLVDGWGATALPATMAAFGAAAVLPGLASSTLGLSAALFVLGAGSGAVDVAINAEGTRSETATGQPLLSLAHGTFSACVVVGSLATGGLRAAGAGAELVLALVGGLVVAIAIGLSQAPAAGGAHGSWRDIVVPGKDAARVACSARERARTPPGATRAARLRQVPRILLVIGGLCALAFFVENAWQSWGAVHLESDLDASPALGALAPALFAGAAAASRLGGHALVGRFDEILLMRVGAAAGAAGTVVAALAPAAALALAGIAVAGAGISICAPILFSLAGRNADEAVRGAAVSVVTTIAYLGFLVGPAAVGLLADATTLRASLAGAGAVALLLAVLAGRARPRRPTGPPSQGSEH